VTYPGTRTDIRDRATMTALALLWRRVDGDAGDGSPTAAPSALATGR